MRGWMVLVQRMLVHVGLEAPPQIKAQLKASPQIKARLLHVKLKGLTASATWSSPLASGTR